MLLVFLITSTGKKKILGLVNLGFFKKHRKVCVLVKMRDV